MIAYIKSTPVCALLLVLVLSNQAFGMQQQQPVLSLNVNAEYLKTAQQYLNTAERAITAVYVISVALGSTLLCKGIKSWQNKKVSNNKLEKSQTTVAREEQAREQLDDEKSSKQLALDSARRYTLPGLSVLLGGGITLYSLWKLVKK